MFIGTIFPECIFLLGRCSCGNGDNVEEEKQQPMEGMEMPVCGSPTLHSSKPINPSFYEDR
jgi:hypothetical protein